MSRLIKRSRLFQTAAKSSLATPRLGASAAPRRLKPWEMASQQASDAERATTRWRLGNDLVLVGNVQCRRRPHGDVCNIDVGRLGDGEQNRTGYVPGVAEPLAERVHNVTKDLVGQALAIFHFGI